MDPQVCYKRREYLIIHQHHDDDSDRLTQQGYANGIKKKNDQKYNVDATIRTSKNLRIYCGNWNKLKQQNQTQNGTTNMLPKSLHIVGNAAKSNSSNNNFGFLLRYVVRSAMPPVINDGKRNQQQHGFKVKVSPHENSRPSKSYFQKKH